MDIPELSYEYCGFIEIWNPQPKDLVALIPFLEGQRKVCIPWVYGPIDSIPDFSSVNHYRISPPIWLGKDKNKVNDEYLHIRNEVIYNLMNF